MKEYLDKYGGKKGMTEERLEYFSQMQGLKKSDQFD